MDKKLFVVSLVVAFLAFPALADDTATAAPEADGQQPAAAQEPAEVTAAPSCESSAPEAQALDPFVAEPFQDLQPAAGETCGGAVCGKFEYCCNPSCSNCVLYGMSCTQESCN